MKYNGTISKNTDVKGRGRWCWLEGFFESDSQDSHLTPFQGYDMLFPCPF